MALRAGKCVGAAVREVVSKRTLEGRSCYWILTLTCGHESVRIQQDEPTTKWSICEPCTYQSGSYCSKGR